MANYILEKEAYSTYEVAKLIQMSHETIRRHIAAGYIKAHKMAPTKQGHYRIFRDELATYLKSRGATVAIQ